jgi:hypothetical protein
MGLDMYAWRVKAEDAVNDFEIKKDEDGESVISESIGYWRKHHDLHGWMEKLYRAKGGDNEVFNCVKVRLTLEDLDRLETDVTANKLPVTTGFFFGDNPPDLESIAEDLDFIVKARQSIEEGYAVYYDSWW